MNQAALSAAGVLVVVTVAYLMTRTWRATERSAARHRALIDLAPDAFFLANLEGRFTDVNQTACRMLGYERQELIGKSISDVLPAEEAARLTDVRTRLLVPGKVERGEWRHVRKDGTVLPVEVSANILPGGLWQAFVRDITDRKRIEREQRLLAEAGAVLSASLDYEQTLTTLGRLMVRDLADWCVVDIVEDDDRPRRLKVVSGRPEQARLAARLEQLRLDRRLPHLSKPALETRRSFVIEDVTPERLASFGQSEEHLHILRAIGPRSIMGLPLMIRGELRGVLVLMSSTPSRRYAADDLLLGEALAERAALAIENGRLYRAALSATQMRDEVLGVVAHDLRNPVTTIMMQAAALRRRGPEPERRNQKPAESIIRAAKRMNRLIGDLLDVTLIEAGRLGIQRERVAGCELVAEAVEAQRPLATSASLDIRLEIGDGLPDLWADHHRLLQVFENLIGNAIKFTPVQGRITIGAAPRDGEVLFWVADSGAGIGPDGLPHVFDRFWQASKGSGLGLGLGLPIARGIIEAHGGRIWVESVVGRGTIVFFTVPEARSDQGHAAQSLH